MVPYVVFEYVPLLTISLLIIHSFQNPQDGFNRLKRIVMIGDHHQVKEGVWSLVGVWSSVGVVCTLLWFYGTFSFPSVTTCYKEHGLPKVFKPGAVDVHSIRSSRGTCCAVGCAG